jgi:hypothetical protein
VIRVAQLAVQASCVAYAIGNSSSICCCQKCLSCRAASQDRFPMAAPYKQAAPACATRGQPCDQKCDELDGPDLGGTTCRSGKLCRVRDWKLILTLPLPEMPPLWCDVAGIPDPLVRTRSAAWPAEDSPQRIVCQLLLCGAPGDLCSTGIDRPCGVSVAEPRAASARVCALDPERCPRCNACITVRTVYR